MTHPISAAVQDVLDLYATDLAPVRFGDLEAGVLALAADEVNEAARVLALAEATLDAARGALAEKQETLLQKAHRALAYARVYAEDEPELAARIERIALPRSGRRPLKMELGETAPLAAA